jgi:uncharacterized protein (DUF1499 family)
MREPAARRATILVWTGAAIVLVAVAFACVAGPGYQADLWTFSTGFTILRWSVYSAAAGGLLALAGVAVLRRVSRMTVLGVVAALAAIALVVPSWQLQRTADMLPRIHDITTDTENPPQFVALLFIRAQTLNGPEYGGEKVARAQKAAYPDIQPVLLPDPPARAFDRALAAARGMNWEIVAAEAGDGRIEATATTRWFRFKDDVIVRIAAEGTGSRIDIRSKSRIGRSDLGANAKRIRAYVQKLRGS